MRPMTSPAEDKHPHHAVRPVRRTRQSTKRLRSLASSAIGSAASFAQPRGHTATNGVSDAADAATSDKCFHKWTTIVQHSLVSTVPLLSVPIGYASDILKWQGRTAQVPPTPVVSTGNTIILQAFLRNLTKRVFGEPLRCFLQSASSGGLLSILFVIVVDFAGANILAIKKLISYCLSGWPSDGHCPISLWLEVCVRSARV